FLVFVELVIGEQVVVAGEEKAAGAAGRISDSFAGLGPDAFDHNSDQGARREILARAGFGVLGVFLQQAFVDFAFGVGAKDDPLGFVHHGYDAGELGRVLDFIL